MKTKLFAFLVMTLIVFSAKAQLTEELYFDYDIPPNTNPLPSGTLYVDRWGYSIDNWVSPTTSNVSLLSGGAQFSCGKFIFVYEDVNQNSKYGFDDTTHITLSATHPLAIQLSSTTVTLGELRRWTVCKVFEYISRTINVNTTTPPKILFKLSDTSGSRVIASGTPVYNNDTTRRFERGALNKHIVSNITPASLYDAMIVCDFGIRDNGATKVNSDANNTSLAAGIDLFSVILHEATHAMGFLSMIGENGNSTFTNTSPGVYSFYDKFLQDKYNNVLVYPSTYAFYSSGAPGALKSNGIIYNATPLNNQIDPVYSPVTWSFGTSMSHFDDRRGTENYLMCQAYRDNLLKRAYTKPELEVLCNLGYTFDTATINNIFNCYAKYPVGINDTISTSNLTAPIVIDVINNDVIPSGQTVQIYQVDYPSISYAGTVAINPSNKRQIIFTPSGKFCGEVSIKYIPYNTTGNHYTGTSAILKIIINCPGFCPNAPCNYICQGDFENGNTDYWGYNQGESGETLANWNSIGGTPDFFHRKKLSPQTALPIHSPTANPSVPAETITGSNTGNDGIMRCGVYSSKSVIDTADISTYYTETFGTYLSNKLTQGQTYKLEYWVRAIAYDNTTINKKAYSKISFFDTLPLSNSAHYLTKGAVHSKTDTTVYQSPYTALGANNSWIKMTQTFVSTGTERSILVEPLPTPLAIGTVLFDNFSLINASNILKTTVTVSNPHPNPNDTVTFFIQVCNNTNTALTNISLKDTLPAGYQYVKTIPVTTTYPNFTLSSIPANGCTTIAIVALVLPTVAMNVELYNCAQITTTLASSCSNDPVCLPVSTLSTDINLQAYTPTCNAVRIKIANNGPRNAHNIKVGFNAPTCFGYTGYNIIRSGNPALGAPVTYPVYTSTTKIIDINFLLKDSTVEIEFLGNPTSNCIDSFELISLDEFDEIPLNNTAFIANNGGLNTPAFTTDSLTFCTGVTSTPSLSSLVNMATVISGNTLVWYIGNSTSYTTTTPSYSVATAGTYTFYIAQKNTAGCISDKSLPLTIIVTNAPSPSVIIGNSNICINDSVHFTNATSGGVWSSSNTTIATVSSTGWVKGKVAGTDTIFYTVTSGGCFAKVFFLITVNGKPTLILKNIDTQYCYSPQNAILIASSNASSFDWVTPTQSPTTYPTDTTLEEPIAGTGTFKYYVTAYKNGCSKKDSATVNIKTCYPKCTQDAYVTLTGTLDGTYTTDKVYATYSDLIVPNGKSATFTNSEIIMTANKKITVESNAKLTITGCHIYSCNEMWQGIVVQAGGQLIIDSSTAHSSFIEDAKTAIELVIDRGFDNSYSGKPPVILSVNNTIFNRNNISINITGVSELNSTLNASYINIGNNIFTSRKILFSTLGWSTVKELKASAIVTATNYPLTPQTLIPPYINDIYIIDNNFGAFLKPPYLTGTTKPTAGIILNKVGFNNTLTIGNPNGSQYNYNSNLFDNLAIGIKDSNTALNVKNCSFQKAWLKPNIAVPQGYGIYAGGCAYKQINITTDANKPRNAFWDMQYAVRTNNCYNLFVSNADIRSTQSLADTTSKIGKWGIYVQGASYSDVNLNSNEIINIANGIKIDNTAGFVEVSDSIKVDYNLIKPDFSNLSVNGYVETAITLAGSTSLQTSNSIPVYCRGNQLQKVFNGIVSTGWTNKNIFIDNNPITLKQYTKGSTIKEQWGIKCSGGVAGSSLGNTITNNTVTGSFNSSSNATANQTGIYLGALQSNNNVGCNTVISLTDGFKFFSINKPTQFWDNRMTISNNHGFTLEKGGEIGTQGTTKGGICTSNNIWDSTSAAWMNATHFRTFCNATSDAKSSILFVRNTATFNPDGASGFGSIGINFPYSTSGGSTASIQIKTPTKICIRCNTPSETAIPPRVEDLEPIEEMIPEENPDLDNPDDPDMILVLKQQLYELLKNDPTLLDGSFILNDFMLQNNWSSIDYAYLINRALTEGNIPFATALLNTWSPDGTPDINNFTYYTWLYNMQTDSTYLPDTTAILEMAGKCPITNGRIVYAARNLYNSLTEENLDFANACDAVYGRGVRPPKVKKEQKLVKDIVVYPNPTTGYVYITLPTNENKPCWQITVTDIYGKKITEKSLRANTSKTFINIKGTKGIYFINVLNCTTGISKASKVILE